MLGAIIVAPVTLPSTAQPTGARARVLSSVRTALARTFLGPLLSPSVLARAAPCLMHAARPCTPCPEQARCTSSVKRAKENGAGSQRISREEARRVGRALQMHGSSSAMPTGFGRRIA